jgi:hypothetical protein
VIMDGYGGRAGSFQFDEKVIDGVDTDTYYKRMAAEAVARIYDLPVALVATEKESDE